MNIVFGVKSHDLDEARRWVEAAIGIIGKYGDHMDMGGEYFSFDTGPPTSIILQYNVDIITGEPFTSGKNAKWRIIVAMSLKEKGGPRAAALLAVPLRFTLLGEEEL